MTVRMRHTKAHTRNRRAHHALGNPAITKDSKTGAVSLRHRVSPQTGEYKGKKVIEVSTKMNAKNRARAEATKQSTKKEK